MSLLIPLPRRIQHRLRTVLVRNNSTFDVSKPKRKQHLPPAQMRALISLYHQSDTFITPENLLEKIDEAFVPNVIAHKDHFGAMPNLTDLTNLVEARRSAPKMAVWDAAGFDALSRSASQFRKWSDVDTPRELKVIEALYGVDATHPSARLPGLEVLEDEAENIARQIAEDQVHLEDRLSLADEEVFLEEEGQVIQEEIQMMKEEADAVRMQLTEDMQTAEGMSLGEESLEPAEPPAKRRP